MWQSKANFWRPVMIGAVLAAAGVSLGWTQTTNAPSPEPPKQETNTCLVCHSQQGGGLAAPTKPFPTDIHAERGLGCASCHGGDPTSMDPKIAMNPSAGFRGKPSRQEVPRFCGRCHSDTTYMHRFSPTVQTDQVRQYATSTHGQRLQNGDRRVATCISCHSVHDIKKVSDPASPVYPTNIAGTCGGCHSNGEYMQGYDLPGFSQVADYQKSVHHQSLTESGNRSAPTCVTCHGSHGAIPPGVRSVSDVCGTCHTHNREMFDKSKHRAAFADIGVAGCVQCHGNHAIQRSGEKMLAGSESVCMLCHQDGDAGAQRAADMAAEISRLDQAIHIAQETLQQADEAGMDVMAAAADLTAAHSHLVMSRTAIHSLDLTLVSAEVNAGMPIAGKILQDGRDKLAEVQSRRKGVAAFALLVLGIVLSLFLYIRTENQSQQPNP